MPFLLSWLLVGCDRFRPKAQTESVYVMAKQTYLRDKVAAMSNRVGTVQNGQRLSVLEHGRRFLKVRTEKGETGWIEERSVVDPAIVTGFEELSRQHASDPVVATAVVRDDLYMHLKPGRDTDRFYLLAENEKLQLLARASVPKATPPQAPRPSKPTKPAKAAATDQGAKAKPDGKSALTPGKAAAVAKGASTAKPDPPAPPPEPVPMEDWWLTRDSHQRVGWLLARRLDVDVPDSIGGYSEGQKMVGAYVLTRVFDSESNQPDNMVPEYVSVLGPYQDGLRHDFDQVRVFTWNTKKHRYETAFRQRGLQGYLPVVISLQTLDSPTRQTPNPQPVPTFAFKQGVGDAVAVDALTGAVRPAEMETETYRMDGVMVKKVLPPAPPPSAVTVAPASAAPNPALATKGKRRRAHAAGHKSHSVAKRPKKRGKRG